MKKEKWNNNHFSAMSNSAWCDLNNKSDILKLHDHCHNIKCNCQKQITFIPRQFQLKGARFKNTMKKKSSKISQKVWDSFFNSTINTLAPVIGMARLAKSKNLQVGQALTNF